MCQTSRSNLQRYGKTKFNDIQYEESEEIYGTLLHIVSCGDENGHGPLTWRFKVQSNNFRCAILFVHESAIGISHKGKITISSCGASVPRASYKAVAVHVLDGSLIPRADDDCWRLLVITEPLLTYGGLDRNWESEWIKTLYGLVILLCKRKRTER